VDSSPSNDPPPGSPCLRHIRQLATDKDASIARGHEYVQAMLGFHSYARHIYQTVHSDPYGKQQARPSADAV
jgi:hypothetical protein